MESGMRKQHESIGKREAGTKQMTMTTLRQRTVGTVSYLLRRTGSGFRLMERRVPFIRLSGLWLKNNGFNIGAKFEIHVGTRQLLLAIKNINDLEVPKASADQNVYMVKDSSVT
jgi:hypothetical protein